MDLMKGMKAGDSAGQPYLPRRHSIGQQRTILLVNQLVILNRNSCHLASHSPLTSDTVFTPTTTTTTATRCAQIAAQTSANAAAVLRNSGALWRVSVYRITPYLGRVQQLTGLTGRTIGPANVRPVRCWTAFIVIQ